MPCLTPYACGILRGVRQVKNKDEGGRLCHHPPSFSGSCLSAPGRSSPTFSTGSLRLTDGRTSLAIELPGSLWYTGVQLSTVLTKESKLVFGDLQGRVAVTESPRSSACRSSLASCHAERLFARLCRQGRPPHVTGERHGDRRVGQGAALQGGIWVVPRKSRRFRPYGRRRLSFFRRCSACVSSWRP